MKSEAHRQSLGKLALPPKEEPCAARTEQVVMETVVSFYDGLSQLTHTVLELIQKPMHFIVLHCC